MVRTDPEPDAVMVTTAGEQLLVELVMVGYNVARAVEVETPVSLEIEVDCCRLTRRPLGLFSTVTAVVTVVVLLLCVEMVSIRSDKRTALKSRRES